MWIWLIVDAFQERRIKVAFIAAYNIEYWPHYTIMVYCCAYFIFPVRTAPRGAKLSLKLSLLILNWFSINNSRPVVADSDQFKY